MSKNNHEKYDGFTVDQIELQLEKIIKSSGFINSMQMQNFLSYIAHKRLAGKESHLKQYTIAVEALGQKEGFDADTNPLVRIEAGRLRKKLDHYYQTEGSSDACILSIPVGSYAPVFENNTSTDTKVEVALQQVVDKSCGPKLLVSCFTDKTQGENSSRLLYFITDNLSKVLSRFLFLRLVSAVPHAEKEFSSSVITSYTENHQVDYIVTAYIHRIKEDTYELMCQLIEADSQEILWSESYAVNEQGIDVRQREICNSIAAITADIQQGIMHVHWARKLLQRSEDNIDDRYKVIVCYRLHADNYMNSSFIKAVDVCLQALERNPHDVVALVIYSEYCRREYVYNHGVIGNPLKKGLKSAQEAVRLKPDSHEALYVLGQMWFHLGNDMLCKLQFEESSRLSQHNPLISFGTGFHLFLMGDWKSGMSLVNKVMKSGASFPDWFNMIPFLNYYRLGELDKALVEAHRLISPGGFWGPLARAAIYGEMNKTDIVEAELEELFERYPDFAHDGLPMLKRYLRNDVLYDKLYDGLVKAGIEKWF